MAVVVAFAGCAGLPAGDRPPAGSPRPSAATEAAPPATRPAGLHVGGSPSGLLRHGDRLFVAHWRDGYVSVVDLNRRAIDRQLWMDPRPSADAYRRPDGTTWHRPVTRRYGAGDMAIAGGRLFVLQTFSERVRVYDLATLELVREIGVGDQGSLSASPDGRWVYLANNLRPEFCIIDAQTCEWRVVPCPPGGRGCLTTTVSPDGRYLYLGIQRGGDPAARAASVNPEAELDLPDDAPGGMGHPFLAVYDLAADRYAGTVYLGQIDQSGRADDAIVSDLAFSADGKFLYAAMRQSMAGVWVIDPGTRTIIANVRFPGTGPHHKWPGCAAVAAAGDAWLLSLNAENRELALVDRRSRKTVAAFPLDGSDRGGSDLIVIGGDAVLTNPAAGEVLFVPLASLTARAERPAAATRPAGGTGG